MRNPDGDDTDPLDDEFPLGDGAADTEATVLCPYCAEEVEITLDPGGGPEQEYVEDCEVCCQPWRVNVAYTEDGHAEVTVQALDE
ncbi:MAG: CPXCG motif-containing cysteine-rich protein [Gemmatimonadaceae bacterium]|nr:CPXCG motif-containing cysteine-rich protein [Gemmatimonadaceae bacterium]